MPPRVPAWSCSPIAPVDCCTRFVGSTIYRNCMRRSPLICSLSTPLSINLLTLRRATASGERFALKLRAESLSPAPSRDITRNKNRYLNSRNATVMESVPGAIATEDWSASVLACYQTLYGQRGNRDGRAPVSPLLVLTSPQGS